MTPEQKQRIEQIRERLRRSELEPHAPDEWWSDIDFLLSLVKEQEAEIRLLRRASADPEDKQYGATVYDGSGNYSLLAQNAINRNVDLMRSACVEKVKALRDRWWAVYRSSPEPVRDPKFMKGMDAAAGQFLLELETLSIEKPKE